MKRQHSEAILPLLRIAVAALAVLHLGPGSARADSPKNSSEPVLLVVMDPLARELACACVKGYGQRDYRKLAARLEKNLKQRINIEFSDDLADTLALAGPHQEVIVAGERSLVAQNASRAKIKIRPVAELTDPEGASTLTGAFVVRATDPARGLKDIAGRNLLLGLADTPENHTAISAALRAAGVDSPAAPEKRSTYSDAALDVLDSQALPPPAAVIPAYALRLLEGCGSTKPGELKVIGQTGPLPFIAVFVAERVSADKSKKILDTLMGIQSDGELLKAMESRDGFKPLPESNPGGPKAGTNGNWPDWRGAGRDGHVPRLPARLPATANVIWKQPAMPGCLAGLSASNDRVILAERDFGEESDVYRCLDAGNGELLWRIEFAARGKLDYGQSPRATPVIHDGRAFLLGAFGELRCVRITDGSVIWKRNLLREFKAPLPIWGMCSPPLLVDDLLIVNPGATNASLAALDPLTGRTRWTSPGSPAAYAAFICGTFGGRRQIVGYDEHSLGGWDPRTGERLWRLVPPVEGDFNVPTPIAVDGSLLVATENNATRLHHFDSTGRIVPKPAAEFADLSPDTTTPVVTLGRVFGADLGLYCLDVRKGLKGVWQQDDSSLGDHVSLIADEERVLVITLGGELILLEGRSDNCAVISRLKLFPEEVEVYSHPALVGSRLYIRGGASVLCVDLETPAEADVSALRPEPHTTGSSPPASL